jgi:hypothetical protein
MPFQAALEWKRALSAAHRRLLCSDAKLGTGAQHAVLGRVDQRVVNLRKVFDAVATWSHATTFACLQVVLKGRDDYDVT